jgi:hypothetical protein
MKFCSLCCQPVSILLFVKRKRSKDGLDSWCKACSRVKAKEWNKENRQRRRSINKAYATKNRYKVLQDMRDWYRNNATRTKENIKRRTKEREKTDTNFLLTRRLRSRLGSALKGNYKTGSAVRDLGCSIEFLRQHLESQWQEGMSWDNYGRDGWEIDHIVPLGISDLSDPNVFKTVCHYTNLRPLWKAQNLSRRFPNG